MKFIYFLLSIGLFLVTMACTSNVVPTPSPTETVSAPNPTATVRLQATQTPEAYPALPTSTPTPEDYPANPTPQLQATGYPAESDVWVIRPLGRQCADPDSYEYADLEAAVNALQEAGVDVMASETTELAVCQACDCPTSEHFRVQISARHLSLAESQGWQRE